MQQAGEPLANLVLHSCFQLKGSHSIKWAAKIRKILHPTTPGVQQDI